MTSLSLKTMTNKVDTSLWDIEAKQHSKRVYFNKPQLLTQYIGAKTTVIVAGRRTGKTDSIASPFVLRNMQRMPGSTGGIVVPTFKHGLTNTLPGLLAAWKRWGYINGVHYVVGRKPPKSFAKPITEPADYEHVITFYNGSVAIIISQDRPGSSNSLTLSWLLIDEAKFIDYNKLKDETLPANGGIRSYFGHHSFNHSMMVLSDMPQTTKGSWFLHYEDKMDTELIDTIKGTIYKIWQTKERIAQLKELRKPIPSYLPNYLKWLDQSLNKMRSVAVYYKEYSTLENLQLLGEEYIRQMKRDLTPKLSRLLSSVRRSASRTMASTRQCRSTTNMMLRISTTSTRSATTASLRRRSRTYIPSTPTTSSLRSTVRSIVARTRTSTLCNLSVLAWTTMLTSTGLCAVSHATID